MEDDYYAILGITKSANTDEIKKAYKKLALKYHPDKNGTPNAGEKFRLIAKAYQMVFARKKALISNYSEKQEKTRAQEKWNDIFATFFDTPNNCTDNDLGDYGPQFSGKKLSTNISPIIHGNMSTKTAHRQVIPKEQYLFLTLEEVLNGCTKKIAITSKVFSRDAKICRKEKKDFTIDVKPGMKTGTKIVIKTECNQKLSAINDDIVFVVRDSAHKHFTRIGADIVYKAKISLKEALIGCQLNIPTLTESTIKYDVNAIVSPETIIRLPSLGLPHFKAPHKRGDIVVQFEIMFPDVVSGDVKRVLRDYMP